ncbi:hypothetical protein [Candidatus Poriferisodalis sp.]|uniref:hypothetical protein n=1 Tax=Candidatus Poriferisodalis sp. TaxID=3101277 RepID=UPI003C6EBC9B
MDRGAFGEALAEVAERLHRRGAVARIYVGGGAAMALAYDAERASYDIDSVIMDGYGPLIEVVGASSAPDVLAIVEGVLGSQTLPDQGRKVIENRISETGLLGRRCATGWPWG